MEQLLKIMIGRAKKILMPARKYLTIVGLVQSKSRLIGSGLIGEKAVDLVLARTILTGDPSNTKPFSNGRGLYWI
ncbi:MAG: hypothetical protein ACM3X9_10900 [Bacillota bacterium]